MPAGLLEAPSRLARTRSCSSGRGRRTSPRGRARLRRAAATAWSRCRGPRAGRSGRPGSRRAARRRVGDGVLVGARPSRSRARSSSRAMRRTSECRMPSATARLLSWTICSASPRSLPRSRSSSASSGASPAGSTSTRSMSAERVVAGGAGGRPAAGSCSPRLEDLLDQHVGAAGEGGEVVEVAPGRAGRRGGRPAGRRRDPRRTSARSRRASRRRPRGPRPARRRGC